MTAANGFILRELPKLLWISAVFAFVAGYYAVDRHFEHAINSAAAQTEELYRKTVSNERIIRQSRRLESIQAAVERDLAVYKAQNYAGSTESLLQILQNDGERFGITVVAIEPAQAAQKGQEPVDGLSGLSVTIRARGGFGALLLFVQDLPRQRVLLGITNTELRRASIQSPDAQSLEATIHATLFTFRATSEEQHAPAF